MRFGTLLSLLLVVGAAHAAPSTQRIARSGTAQRVRTGPLSISVKPALLAPHHEAIPWRTGLVSTLRALPKNVKIVVVSDYDGTLSEKTGDPRTTVLSAAQRHTVEALRDLDVLTVSTGRDLLSAGKVLPDNVHTVSAFGLQTKSVNGTIWEHPLVEEAKPHIAKIHPAIESASPAGTWVENKGFSLSMEKPASASLDEWHTFIDKVNHINAQAGTHGALEVKATDKIVEILPRSAPDKGTALGREMEARYGKAWRTKVHVVSIGDSIEKTGGDYRLLEATNEVNGSSVAVTKDPHTHARYTADNVADVHALLAEVQKVIEERQ